MAFESVLKPITKTIIVPLTPDAAFKCYTRDISRWWPLKTHSLGGASAASCTIEPEVGGRIFERETSGVEHLWGTVTIWQPPHRLIHSWRPQGVLDNATMVTLTFVPVDSGRTRLDLIHSGWQSSDADSYKYYQTDWDIVLREGYLQHTRQLVSA
jgi:uncharacterized protein YndB with AHSA1/START domain